MKTGGLRRCWGRSLSARTARLVGLCATLALALPHSAAADFVRGKDIRIDGPTHDIAAADLNRDGKVDLVVTHLGSVEVFKGRGDGRFKPTRGFAVGRYPQEIVAADLDHDGTKDLITANYRSDNVSALIGRGDGTFRQRINYRAGNGPTSVAVGRLNGDRRPDLVVTDLRGNCVSVLLGRRAGTFGSKRSYPIGQTPTSVALADFNGDHKRDIAVADWDEVSLRKGRGDGTFKRRQVIPMRLALDQVVAADFDRDKNPDLAVSNIAYNAVQGVHILLGRGNGQFQGDRHYGFDSAPTKIAAAEMTGDRRKDLVVETEGYPLGIGGPESGYLFVLRSQEKGQFAKAATLHLDDQGGRFAVGDFNGDRKRDIAAVTYTSSPTIEILLNR